MAYSGIKYTNVEGRQEYSQADDMEEKRVTFDKISHLNGQEMQVPSKENKSKDRSIVLSPWKRRLQTYRKRVVYLTLFFLYTVYVIFSLLYDANGAIFVCLLEAVFLFLVIFNVFKVDIWEPVLSLQAKCLIRVKRPLRTKIRIFITVLVTLGLAAFLVWDIWSDVHRFIPVGGITLFVICLWVTSSSPKKVAWMTVTWGLLLQFGMGLIILRWPPGYAACKFLGDCVSQFLSYTDEGSKFVFGDPGYTLHPVAFGILPVVIFFSSVVSVLYYLGIMQFVIRAIAAVLRFVMQTTAIESFATAAHIFIGQVESSVVLKPFLNDLTLSELHAVLTSGFATVAGTVIAAYIEFGVPAEHVISASFMSAPAALAVAKIAFPEAKVAKSLIGKDMELEVGKEQNIMEAVSVGAMGAVRLIANVVVNLVAFVAILAFLDAVLSYFGSRIGYPEISFDFICSYIFMPLAFVMGIPWSQCRLVGKLIGKKIVINEFLAFADLGTSIKAGEIEGRSMVVSTYILCGFGSIAAMGINLGALSAAEPRRRQDLAKLMLRAVVAGNIACFMTACVAGLLYQDVHILQSLSNSTDVLNSTLLNVTEQSHNFTASIQSTLQTSMTGL
ncbi:solute carrier family 28 member 3-like [Saccostrea echinata]|uniref:solute carrier family 28 member 3-like n=1 Tax=Saccostrea echinata TaxID=191078 RepID=UPI002A82E388|nr:solute carrier family 28 member 3-like [Saccostrea echinata]